MNKQNLNFLFVWVLFVKEGLVVVGGRFGGGRFGGGGVERERQKKFGAGLKKKQKKIFQFVYFVWCC